MYKYIIYCSVSAAIIIACKYLYQHWIRQNHTVSNLKQEITILNDKVKRLELELERNKNSISGGVKIPIVFKTIEHRSSSPKTIQLIDEEVSSISSKGSTSKKEQLTEHISEISSKASSKASSKTSIKSKRELDLEEMTAQLDKELDVQQEQQEPEQQEPEQQEQEEKPKKTKKKSTLSDAKDYNNGERITDDNGVEYICVVGKRGGHSWKKL